ncbi:hypothetical protein ACWEFJ_00520 [Actinosynnema sp. NPDC004786]
MDHIPADVARIALDKSEGTSFERFVNVFYAALAGVDFVPLGGHKDGGADARDGTIYQDSRRVTTFYQSSVEVDTDGKIRRTVARLREFGRDVKNLVYFTSQTVKYSDKVERELSEELDVHVAIRDGNYIVAHVNDGPSTRGAFDEHLRHYTDFLKSVGASSLVPVSKHVKSPAVYVFLAQEIERRDGNESLVNSVTDALALWALEGTDPNNLLTAAEVLAKVSSEIPSVNSLVGPRLAGRLDAMSKKNYPGGRAVKFHEKRGYCLPYEVRRRIEEENLADEALRLEVRASLDDRLRVNHASGLGEVGLKAAVDAALRALQIAFEHEGLEFAAFLQADDQVEYTTITDSLNIALSEADLGVKRRVLVGDAAFSLLRGVLYDSRPVERRYLQKLAKTYALLFTLKTEPRLLEFFQEMAGDFNLFVGADQLVRALSEHYLAPADQMTRNTLLMASKQGAKLVLSETVLDELVSHFRVCDSEYRNHVAQVEDHLTLEMARSAPHIMLRAYLYARLNKALGRRRPVSWVAFVNQFCSYSDLRKPSAYGEIRQYLQHTFGLRFESKEGLESLVDEGDLETLAAKLTVGKSEKLARNDALMALAIYGKRKQLGETSKATEFGYSTWWLTGETLILRYSREFVQENGGARYIMRPDYLLNFLTLAPSAAEARRAFSSVFPSLLGIKLARRMSQQTFDKIMGSVAEAESLDEARRAVVIGKAVDQLKSDFNRQLSGPALYGRAASIDIVADRTGLAG